jgi:hypothetical protein
LLFAILQHYAPLSFNELERTFVAVIPPTMLKNKVVVFQFGIDQEKTC